MILSLPPLQPSLNPPAFDLLAAVDLQAAWSAPHFKQQQQQPGVTAAGQQAFISPQLPEASSLAPTDMALDLELMNQPVRWWRDATAMSFGGTGPSNPASICDAPAATPPSFMWQAPVPVPQVGVSRGWRWGDLASCR